MGRLLFDRPRFPNEAAVIQTTTWTKRTRVRILTLLTCSLMKEPDRPYNIPRPPAPSPQFLASEGLEAYNRRRHAWYVDQFLSWSCSEYNFPSDLMD